MVTRPSFRRAMPQSYQLWQLTRSEKLRLIFWWQLCKRRVPASLPDLRAVRRRPDKKNLAEEAMFLRVSA